MTRKTESNDTSFAMELVKGYKATNVRYFIIILVLILCLCALGYYTITLLNGIQTITTTESVDVNDVNTINNSDIGIK